MTIDITSIVQAVLALLAALVTSFLIPWIKSKTSESTQETLAVLTAAAVEAAEQTFVGTGRGAEKKQYVLDWLEKRGIKCDADALDAYVEAAVYELKQSDGS